VLNFLNNFHLGPQIWKHYSEGEITSPIVIYGHKIIDNKLVGRSLAMSGIDTKSGQLRSFKKNIFHQATFVSYKNVIFGQKCGPKGANFF